MCITIAKAIANDGYDQTRDASSICGIHLNYAPDQNIISRCREQLAAGRTYSAADSFTHPTSYGQSLGARKEVLKQFDLFMGVFRTMESVCLDSKHSLLVVTALSPCEIAETSHGDTLGRLRRYEVATTLVRIGKTKSLESTSATRHIVLGRSVCQSQFSHQGMHLSL